MEEKKPPLIAIGIEDKGVCVSVCVFLDDETRKSAYISSELFDPSQSSVEP